MHFSDAHELVQALGWGMTATQVANVTGVSYCTAQKIAKQCKVELRTSTQRIPGLEHLPGLPDFATVKSWRGGTIYRIDCIRAGDSPGYRELLIHTPHRHGEDEREANEDSPHA